MAPFMGPTREAVLEALRAWRPKVPITIGRYEPQVVIDRRDGSWVLLPLVMNHERAKAAGEEALARGGMWMPEMTWRFLEEGPPLVAHADKGDFIDAIAAMPWRWGPES